MASKATASTAEKPIEEAVDEAAIEQGLEFDTTRGLTADNLIKDYVIASVAASIVPVAFLDIAAVIGIQLRMIQKLSQLYGKPFSERLGRKAIYALAGGVLGYGAGYVVAASATKMIPGIGWMVGMVSLPVVVGASTYAVGRSIMQHYENGGTLRNFSAGKMRAFYKEQFEKGKDLARKTKAAAKAESVAEEAAS
ncbi:DUF697 domain-containing protein [Breoghania sp.]|uniref:YcjF family protein n=1 Tax=Breoghania sp. TaxID=2065378 RepID=UPI00261E18EA|nr:DUF697 domain-containing protein [Breoghania sp.]MDJ0933248.1 DUF697 domain-containing protein [Breoghania sp.]